MLVSDDYISTKENEITCVSSYCLLTKNISYKQINLTIKNLKYDIPTECVVFMLKTICFFGIS